MVLIKLKNDSKDEKIDIKQKVVTKDNFTDVPLSPKELIQLMTNNKSLVVGLASKDSNPIKKDSLENKGIMDRVKDFTEDLLDDGKRNHSNNPKKKSPGRKKRKTKF